MMLILEIDSISDKDFTTIEKRMIEIARGKHEYKMRSTTKEEALAYYKGINNEYKLNLLKT